MIIPFFLSLSLIFAPFLSVPHAQTHYFLLFGALSLCISFGICSLCHTCIHSVIQTVDRVNFAHRKPKAPNSEFRQVDNDTSALRMKAPTIICFIALSYLPQSRNCQFMGFGFDSVCVFVCWTFYGLSYRITSYASKQANSLQLISFHRIQTLIRREGERESLNETEIFHSVLSYLILFHIFFSLSAN